ncbi:phage holin [Paraliobacillus ryukyuensis]|uniref:phage holin n=1 Tax=Paraliobacillus ryukyuensis TaxID=200904 RepID=UPI0009A58269|nr:phage holin [Paraliobacillus ryukyuensis]
MDKKSLIRTIVLVVALINQALVAANLNPIPGSEEVWGEVVSTIITGAVAVWAWFKNNYVTAKGKAQKEVIEKAGLK